MGTTTTLDGRDTDGGPGRHERRVGDRRQGPRRTVADRRLHDRRLPGPGGAAPARVQLPARSAGAIARRGLAALVGAVMLAVTLAALVVVLGPDRSGDALAIDVASRQRMLTQRMAGAAVLAASGDAAARERLAAAWHEFDLAHRGLRSGDGTVGITRVPDPALVHAHARPGGLDDQVTAFGRAVETVLAGGRDPGGTLAPDVARGRELDAVEALVAAAGGPLLEALDAAVAIDRRAAARREALVRRLTLGVVVIGVAALAFAAGAVIRPLLAELQRSSALVAATRLEAERRAGWHRCFAGIASHELRTPVTIVAGLAETLQARWDDIDDQLRRDVVERLARQGRGMTDLVAELSTVAGLAAEPIDRTPWRLASVVDLLVDSHGVVVEVAGDQQVTVDRRRLALVLRELVDNAQRHGVAPVTASVVATAAGDVVVEVGDAGDGVPPEAVEGLLAPFTRGTDVVHHSSADGTGIGLAMVAGIAAEADGGVEQVVSGAGCVWRVTFPGLG